jgi:GT2 family glycosyltransferase
MSLLSRVEIGIATKNRWPDLRRTLEQVAAFGLGELRILIFDDASDAPCPYDMKAICPGAELRRFNESSGYIVRRNQLACAMTAKYYLSLDDDSFPVSGSLAEAIEFAESCDDLFCLSFPIYNPIAGRYQVRSLQPTPYRVRSFIGCGHLLRRDRFLELGGYREELVHQGEEVEIAVRAFHRRFWCYHFPGLQIHHTESDTGRNWHRMDFYGARNTVLWNDWYMPNGLIAVKQSRGLVARLIQVVRTRRLGAMQGLFASLKEVRQHRAHRQRMSLSLYRQWKRLPAD